MKIFLQNTGVRLNNSKHICIGVLKESLSLLMKFKILFPFFIIQSKVSIAIFYTIDNTKIWILTIIAVQPHIFEVLLACFALK